MVGAVESIDLFTTRSRHHQGIDLAASNGFYGFLCFFEARAQLFKVRCTLRFRHGTPSILISRPQVQPYKYPFGIRHVANELAQR